MIVQDQSDVCAFLARAVGAETRETHISRLFLGPGRVYKLKRAVRLPFVDSVTKARDCATRIRTAGKEDGARPIVINSLVEPDVVAALRHADDTLGSVATLVAG